LQTPAKTNTTKLAKPENVSSKAQQKPKNKTESNSDQQSLTSKTPKKEQTL
jgi:hypothetical protein